MTIEELEKKLVIEGLIDHINLSIGTLSPMGENSINIEKK